MSAQTKEQQFVRYSGYGKPISPTSTPVDIAEEWIKENKDKADKAKVKKGSKPAKKTGRNPVNGAYQSGSKEHEQAVRKSQAEHRQALMNLQRGSYVRGNT